MKTCVVLTLFLMTGVSLGDIQKRIIDGRKCTADEQKNFVFLKTEDKKSHMVTICSGSVVGNGNWVLTAKHCDAFGASIKVKDIRKKKQTVPQKDIFKHPSADIMLMKLNDKKTAIPLASPTDCTNIKKQLASTKSVKMLLVARDTNVKKGKTMCGDVELRGCTTETQSGAECFYGKPAGCQICGGDSGSGYIYNKVLYAVESGDGTVGTQVGVELAFSVCKNNIRQWIDETMNES